ncbi:MAG: glycosyltransferase family 4 protein [Opitutales bacterium]
MKILHLSSETSWRGGEQQIAYLVEGLEALGIEPIVACKPGAEFESYCERRDWRHYPLPMRSSMDFKSGWALKKLCQDQSIDLIHAHSSHGHGTSFLSYLMGNRTPSLLTRRVDFELKDNCFARWKYTYPGIRKIACVSDAIREIVSNGTGQPEKCLTIYSAINPKKFAPHLGSQHLREKYGLADHITLIGNTSALVDHKDYHTFVDTAAQYIREYDQDVRFFIIGQGEREAEIKDYVKQSQLDEVIIFTGFLENVEAVLPSLDIFFISSKTEGLGTSVIDAFAAKVPVVATRAGGIPELVRHGETGLSSPVGDAPALASHLHRYKEDATTRATIIEKAYEFSKDFSVEQMAQQYQALYESIIAES